MKESQPCSTKPNYKRKCLVCGRKPTVDIYNPEGTELKEHLDMCGPCTFGEADTIDPANW